MPSILIIDDNASVGTALDVLFSLHDIDTLQAQSPAEGLLASPTEVPAGAVTAQGQAWEQLSEDERAYRQCLGAHQDLITQQAGS